MPSRTSSPNSPKKAKRGQQDLKSLKGPTLIIDGDSFAHRSYHALPKTILTGEGRPAGAILGFANRILSLYQAEQPEAVLIGWDTLDSPTYRHKSLPAYQSRHFDKALLEHLDILPTFVAACGFANAKAPGYEADDFLALSYAPLRSAQMLTDGGRILT